MKTAISIPDELFQSAEALAKEMAVSRSALYAAAVSEYVAKYRSSDVTARLNKVYATEQGHLPESVRQAQARSVRSAEW